MQADKWSFCPIAFELGDIGHPLLVGNPGKEVALQNIGHVHFAQT
jgi:hypothetical protein